MIDMGKEQTNAVDKLMNMLESQSEKKVLILKKINGIQQDFSEQKKQVNHSKIFSFF